MSNWIVITIADLYNAKAAVIIDTANSLSLANGQADRITGLIADVTLEIRRKVARCNSVDQNTAAIPGGLKTCAVDIIYCRLKTAVQMKLTPAEQKTLAAREKDLERIATGEDMVDAPDNPIAPAVIQDIPQPSFGGAPRDLRTNRLDG